MKKKNNKKTKKPKNHKKNKTNKNKKTIKCVKQKGGEEHMSNLDPEIKKRREEKEKKRLLLQTLVKLIRERAKKNKNPGNQYAR
jgi:hypothetical protein